MVPRTTRRFLIKIIPVFVLLQIGWNYFGISGVYHKLLEACLDAVAPFLDRSGLVTDVLFEGKNLVLRIAHEGRTGQVNLPVRIFTNNWVLLVALYLASPIRPTTKVFAACFVSALALIYAIHFAMVVIAANAFFMLNPNAPQTHEYSSAARWFMHSAMAFYPRYGEFLAVFLLWCPYVLWYFFRERWGAPTTPPDHTVRYLNK